jgi:hypothetical protein
MRAGEAVAALSTLAMQILYDVVDERLGASKGRVE